MKKADKIKTQMRAKNNGTVSIFYIKNRNGPIIFSFILLALLFIGLASAHADVTLIKAPLSWYEGGAGDYALPKLINAEYALDGFVETQGQVKTICVNYESAGKVAVEVSADKGLHYYPVINGAPLTDNFVSSNQIKWRAKILDEGAKLNALNITYTDSAGITSSFGSVQLSGFNYRKEILFKNPSGQDLFNYQIKLKVGIDKKTEGADVNCEGNARQDFLDVRFAAADGETPLLFYRESISGQVATFWVKVPQIPAAGVKIYIYYGNSKAGDLSNPKNTFDFYDDFKNTELDAGSWVVKVDTKGSYELKDGQLKLDAAELITKDFIFKEGIVEYAVSVDNGLENNFSLRTKTGDNYDTPELVAYSSAYKGAEQCIAIDDIVKANDALATPIAAGGKYNYRLTASGNDIIFERMDQVSGAAQAKVTYSGFSAMKAGYLGLKSGGDGSGRNIISYSEIRVRKFAGIQPLVDKTGAQEQANLPIFSNITFSGAGGLILYDNTKEGIYISKTIPAGFTARIIVPSFKGVNASVAVSADNGANYKEDCVSTSFYYASDKDFAAGAYIKGKIRLAPGASSRAASEFTELKLDYSPGIILVVKPNGGETLSAGASSEILWSALDYDSNYPIKLEYSLDNGKNYNIVTDKVSNSGSYSWDIPSDATSQTALIRASDSNEASVNDVSDSVFVIQGIGDRGQEAAAGEQAVSQEQEQKETQRQAGADLNDPDQDYVIDKDVTISTKSDIAFKTLTLGDGIGAHTSKIILNNNINPSSGKIIIRQGGQLIQANNNAQAILGDLIIEQGGILTHLGNTKDKKYQLNLTAQNVILKPGAIVSAYAKGYSAGEARQVGAGAEGGKYIGKAAGGGKHIYDTERMPKELGSGGAGSWLAKGGAGGGAIWLTARNEFSISGIVNADGKAGEASSGNAYDGAGGAGGSIYLAAQKFSGSTAKITAAGGSGNKTGGAGAGGRIHIKAPAGKISGTLNVNGGSGLDAAAGSVIVE